MELYLIFGGLLAYVLVMNAVWPGRPNEADMKKRMPFVNRCYAHRGLYKKNQSIPENSLPAFAAAAEAGYGMELDVQFTRDKKLIVFHDDTLDRMTPGKGWVNEIDFAALRKLPLAGTEFVVPLLSEVLDTVQGRTPLIVEIKGGFRLSSGYVKELAAATVEALREYKGDYCIESFDPRILRYVGQMAPHVLRGQLADSYAAFRQQGANPLFAFWASHLMGNWLTRPDFIAWSTAPRNWAVKLCANAGAMMVFWTALPDHNQHTLQQENDAIIFQWYKAKTAYKK